MWNKMDKTDITFTGIELLWVVGLLFVVDDFLLLLFVLVFF